jgi:hypothetical protein
VGVDRVSGRDGEPSRRDEVTSPARPDETGHGDARGLFDAFQRSPLSGLTPWIAVSLINGPGRFAVAAVVALGISALLTTVGHRRGTPIKPLEVMDLAYFTVLAVFALAAPAEVVRSMEHWSGEIANVALVLFALGTIALRNPFTLAYAREQTPAEYWDTAPFLRINYLITWAWTLSFLLSMLSGAYGDFVLDDPDNFWTAWIIQIAGTVAAAAFTAWYPKVAEARELAKVGAPVEEPAPPLWKLFEWVPSFVAVTGIALIATDSGPTLLGAVLIVLGVAGALLLRVAQRRQPGSPRA